MTTLKRTMIYTWHRFSKTKINPCSRIFYLPVNRFLPLRSYAEEGPLLDGLVSGSGVVVASVVVVVVVVVVVAVVVVVTGDSVVGPSGKSS